MRKVTVSRMRERYAQPVLTFRITYVKYGVAWCNRPYTPGALFFFFFFTMEDEIYSLTVKCVGYLLIQRVLSVERELQEEDISKNYKFLHGDYMCDGTHVTFISIFTGVRTKRFQVLLPTIPYWCFRGQRLCVVTPRTHLQEILLKPKFRWIWMWSFSFAVIPKFPEDTNSV